MPCWILLRCAFRRMVCFARQNCLVLHRVGTIAERHKSELKGWSISYHALLLSAFAHGLATSDDRFCEQVLVDEEDGNDQTVS
jgi:hypothetical protein